MTELPETEEPLIPVFATRSRTGSRYTVGFATTAGEVVIDPMFEDGDWFFNGLAAVQLGGKWGFIDARGEWRIPPQSQLNSRFSCGRAATLQDGKWGYVDGSGDVVVEHRFDIAAQFIGGFAAVRVGDAGWMLIDPSGEPVFDETLEDLGEVSEGLVAAQYGGKWGYLDPVAREWHLTPRFSGTICSSFQEDRARVLQDGKFGFINRDGDFVIKPSYESALDFREGLAPVGDQDRCFGCIDREGRMAIEFDEVVWGMATFSERLASVSIDEKGVGFIDKQGGIVIPPRFLDASPFRDGVSFVVTASKVAYIDRAGRTQWEGKYVQAPLWINQPHLY